jgi:hypothetical protein
MMNPKSISQALNWLRQAGVTTAGKPLILEDLFRAAFVSRYGKYDRRCEYCINNFKQTGRVPEFLSQFIVKHLVVPIKEQRHESEHREETRSGEQDLLRLWQEWSNLWLGGKR